MEAGIGDGEDPRAVGVEDLAWLVNSPKHDVVVVDERGYPIRMSVPDPRSFALHKAWLSSRDDRDPVKRRRDGGQARLVAEIATERLPHLPFDGRDLSAIPSAIRQAARDILPAYDKSDDASGQMEPDW